MNYKWVLLFAIFIKTHRNATSIIRGEPNSTIHPHTNGDTDKKAFHTDVFFIEFYNSAWFFFCRAVAYMQSLIFSLKRNTNTRACAHSSISFVLSLYAQANKVLGSVVSVISVSACHLYDNHSRRSASLWSSSSSSESESSPSSLQKMLIRVAFACLEASIISFAHEEVQQQNTSFLELPSSEVVATVRMCRIFRFSWCMQREATKCCIICTLFINVFSLARCSLR